MRVKVMPLDLSRGIVVSGVARAHGRQLSGTKKDICLKLYRLTHYKPSTDGTSPNPIRAMAWIFPAACP
jgi:hypothetical protein